MLEVEEVLRRDRRRLSVRIHAGEIHQAIRSREPERIEQHAVHETENGRRGTDGERERGKHGQREHGAAPELAQREADVLGDEVHLRGRRVAAAKWKSCTVLLRRPSPPELDGSQSFTRECRRLSRNAAVRPWDPASHERTVGDHSDRIAVSGSIDAARRAGMSVAATATSVTIPIATVSTRGSRGLMPTRIVDRAPVEAIDSSKPTATPTHASRIPCPTTRRKMTGNCAPSATRTPISRVRCVTAYEMTP